MKIINIYKKINEKIAIRITSMVSTMTCAYAFSFLALISLPAAIHLGVPALISWIAQTFLQLVLLAVILVSQDIQSKKSEGRAIQDHAMLIAQLKEIKEMNESLRQLLAKEE